MFIVTADFVDNAISYNQELSESEVKALIANNYIKLDKENIFEVDAEYWLTVQPDLETGKKVLFKRWMDYVEGRILDDIEWFGEYNTDNNPETIRKKMEKLGKDVLDNSEPTSEIFLQI